LKKINNKKTTGDYYRNIIKEIENNLIKNEIDMKKYSWLPRWFKVRKRNRILKAKKYYTEYLADLKKRKLAI
tara:strand:- start:357 stop:572 length:216 start_codon:yes stop_codon:yes gene_type:complete